MSSCKADKFASEEEIIGSANYRVIGSHPLQLCLVAKGSTNNYSIVLHMYNQSAGSNIAACSFHTTAVVNRVSNILTDF